MAPGFEDFAQLLLRFGGGAVEDDVGDPDFFRFLDLDGDGGASGNVINGGRQHGDGGVLIAGFLVKLLHVLGVVEKFDLVQGLAGFGGELLLEFAEAELFVAGDFDVGDDGFALHQIGQVNAVGGVGVVDADIAEEAGVVEAGLVFLNGGVEEALAFPAADVGADEGVADGGRADGLDVDFVDQFRRLGAGHEGQEQEQQPQAAANGHKEVVEEVVHLGIRRVFQSHLGGALEAGVALEEGQINLPGGAVALFGNIKFHWNGVLIGFIAVVLSVFRF